jgi:hypothetical protein
MRPFSVKTQRVIAPAIAILIAIIISLGVNHSNSNKMRCCVTNETDEANYVLVRTEHCSSAIYKGVSYASYAEAAAALPRKKERTGETTAPSVAQPTTNTSSVTQTETVSPSSESGDAQLELSLWDAVKDSNNITLLLHFIQQYPASVFVAVARAKISALDE